MKNLGRSGVHWLALALACISMGACGEDDDEQAGGGLSDQQTIGVLIAINEGEVQLGQLAQTQARDAAVREFASRMVTEHSGALQRVQDLAAGERLPAGGSLLQARLQTEVEYQQLLLQEAESAQDFDLLYLCGQSRLHGEALDTLDESLRPSVNSSGVRQEVDATRSMVADHLELAQQLVRTLSRQAPGLACAPRGGS